MDRLVSILFMVAWFAGNGALVMALLGILGLGLEGYTVGTRIMLALVILFLASAGNLLALHVAYPDA